MPSAPIFCACRASSIVSSTASALTWIVTGTRPATVFTATSAKRLRSAMVRLSDSPLWCGQEIAVAPVRTWKSSSFSKVVEVEAEVVLERRDRALHHAAELVLHAKAPNAGG